MRENEPRQADLSAHTRNETREARMRRTEKEPQRGALSEKDVLRDGTMNNNAHQGQQEKEKNREMKKGAKEKAP